MNKISSSHLPSPSPRRLSPVGAVTVIASSHREAPMIAEDQFADNTDVYAFISPTDPEPARASSRTTSRCCIPQSGPNFYRFSDDARYEIHIDNDGDASTDLTYRYEFETAIEERQHVPLQHRPGRLAARARTSTSRRRTRCRKIDHKTGTQPHHGRRAGRAVERRQALVPELRAGRAPGGRPPRERHASFAGPRDEPFFVDLHVFDLLGVGGAPTTDGVNVMSLVLEVPITEIAQGRRAPDRRRRPRPVRRRHLRHGVAPADPHPAQEPRRRRLRQVHPGLAPRLAADQRGRSSRSRTRTSTTASTPEGRRRELRRVHPRPRGAEAAQPRARRRLPGDAGRWPHRHRRSARPNGTTPADLLRINITPARPTRSRTSRTAARSPTT